MNDKKMFDNWMKKKEEIQSRIEQTDKMVKDRQDELNYLVNKVEELEGKFFEALNGTLLKRYNDEKEDALTGLAVAVEALEFYSDINNCLTVNEYHEDSENFPTLSGGLYMTGKRARQALKAIKEI